MSLINFIRLLVPISSIKRLESIKLILSLSLVIINILFSFVKILRIVFNST